MRTVWAGSLQTCVVTLNHTERNEKLILLNMSTWEARKCLQGSPSLR